MAKKKAKGKKKGAKKAKKKGGKKRKLSPILKAWSECPRELGIKPFKKLTRKERSAVEACVAKKTRNVKKTKKA